jgi:hypothetical protein
MTGSDADGTDMAEPSRQIRTRKSLPTIVTGRPSPYTCWPTPSPWSRANTPRAEGHPQFVQYLQEVLGGIKDWQTQAEEHVGVNLRTLSRDQQQLYQALLQLNTDAQEAGTIAEETAEQYWEELQSLRQHMKGQQEERDQQIAEALRLETATRESQGHQLATHISDTRSIMETFVANQLPHLINQRVAEALQVERIRAPPQATYTKEEVDRLVQQAVKDALEVSGNGSRESTPRSRIPDPPEDPTRPPGTRKGKEREAPPQGPPVPPKPPRPSPPPPPSSSSSSSSSDLEDPSAKPTPVKGKKGKKYYFTIQTPAGDQPRPRR